MTQQFSRVFDAGKTISIVGERRSAAISISISSSIEMLCDVLEHERDHVGVVLVEFVDTHNKILYLEAEMANKQKEH